MFSGKYALRSAPDEEEWDKFVDASPQGTVFSHSSYLTNCGVQTKQLFVYRGNAIKAAISLVVSDDGAATRIDDLLIYNGLMFKLDPEQRPSSGMLERCEITEFVVEELDRRFSAVHMRLSPHFEDLRPFLWHNYHSHHRQDKFSAEIRYTSYLQIEEFQHCQVETDMGLFKAMERRRRRQVNEAGVKGASMELATTPDTLCRLYGQMFEREGIDLDPGMLDRIQFLLSGLVRSQRGVIFNVRETDGSISYTIAYGIDRKRAYALFAAGIGDRGPIYAGTFAYWASFGILSRIYKVDEVDLEGVNSPQRGWFKLSFGGDIRPYYRISKG